MRRDLQKFAAKTFFHTVDLRLLRTLLERHAAHLGDVLDYFTCRSEATTRNVLLAYFSNQREAFPTGLLNDLYRLARLSTDVGFGVLRELADEARVPLLPPEPWSYAERARLTPRHVALRALIDFPDVFADALMRMPFRTIDRPAEFIGEDEWVTVDLAARLESLEEAVRAHYHGFYQGKYCTIEHYEDGGALHLLLGHGRARSSRLVVDEEHNEAYPVCDREVAHDTLVFVPETGRLFVKARTKVERRCLADTFASVVLRRPMFFQHIDSLDVYTPQPLVDAGGAFRMRPRHQDIVSAHLTFVHVARRRPYMARADWSCGMHDPENAVWRLFEQMPGLQLGEFEIDQVDFRFVFRDRRRPDGPRRHRAVKLKFPNVLIYDRSSIRPDAIQQELRAHGFTCESDRPSADAVDLFA
jgi:hypothetical protein